MRTSIGLVAAVALASGAIGAPGAAAGAGADEAAKGGPMIEKRDFGKAPDGTPVDLYVLSNGRITVKVMTYGAIVTEIDVPDRDGKPGNVVLGFDDLKGYLAGHPFFGATVGRVANRIAGGKFTIDGKDYTLAVNNGPNSLHGGKIGFDKAVWKAEDASGPSGPAVRMSHLSPDGDEGYPGNLAVAVMFTVTADDALKIDYAATTDQPTPVNLTNHTYFNLAGPASGTVLGQELMVNSDRYTPGDDTMIPTGRVEPVRGTPYDFTTPTPIGARIDQIKGDPGGYDLNYVLGGDGKTPALAARVRDPASGRVLEMFTTEPGVQFYTGNFLDGTLTGPGGAVFRKNQGFCLEAQHYPDSVHQPDFPSVILRPGATYRQVTIYRFSAPKP